MNGTTHQVPRLHIVGRQNHGKTTLILELIARLEQLGLRVGTIKHTSHAHELDTPGKDSHRQRIAGAAPAAVVSRDVTAVFIPRLDPEHPYEVLDRLFDACDVILVEGHLEGPGPHIEVWRAAVGTAPIASERNEIAYVISDDAPEVGVPVIARTELGPLVALVHRFATSGSLDTQRHPDR